MDYRERLRQQLEEIFKKQEETEINKNLYEICKELDGFTQRIKNCLDKDIDLPQADQDRIEELNNQYNNNIDRFKKLKGIE